MNKLWVVALVLGLLLMGLSASLEYPLMTIAALAGGVLFLYGVIAGIKAKSAQKREAEERAIQAKQKQEHDEMLRQAKADMMARKKAEDAERFRRETFPVAGVTFQNEDGTERQKILKEIVLNQYGSCEVWFDENEGEDAGIKVLTEFGCVGFIRRSDKAKIRKFFDKKVNTISLDAEQFENEDGEKIYRADVIVGMDKNDPEQAWYFE